jgi:hypothetical protein
VAPDAFTRDPALTVLTLLDSMANLDGYLEKGARQRHLPKASIDLPLVDLARLGSLAASSHNTQPWRFRVGADFIEARPDLGRRCPVVDPDDSHLVKSLGCAAENIAVAAPAFGRRASVLFDTEERVARIELPSVGHAEEPPLYRMIALRQCTRSAYEPRPINPEHLAELKGQVSGEGVEVKWLDCPEILAEVRRLVAEGNRRQLGDRRFRLELLAWIRFSAEGALGSGDGLCGISAGRKTTLPEAAGRLLSPLVVTAGGQVRQDEALLRSTPLLALLAIARDDAAHWFEAGRVYERLALAATAFGIRNAFVNQPIEVRDLRPSLAEAAGLGSLVPTLLLRLGYGDALPASLRRPFESVCEVVG